MLPGLAAVQVFNQPSESYFSTVFSPFSGFCILTVTLERLYLAVNCCLLGFKQTLQNLDIFKNKNTVDLYAGFFDEIHRKAERLYTGANEVLGTLQDRIGVPARIQGIGPRFCLFFGQGEEVTELALNNYVVLGH